MHAWKAKRVPIERKVTRDSDVNNTDLTAYCDTVKTMPVIWRNKGMGRERFRPSERRRVASRLRWFAAKESKARILTLESNYPSHGKRTSYARMSIFTSTSDYLVRFQFQQSEIVRLIEKDDLCGFPFGAIYGSAHRDLFYSLS